MINIIETKVVINTFELDKAISAYEDNHTFAVRDGSSNAVLTTAGKQSPYLFMNENTMKELEKKFKEELVYPNPNYYYRVCSIPYYNGCRIFIVDDMEYGDIELR